MASSGSRYRMPGAPTTSRERFRDQQGVYVGTRTTISAARARGVGADAEVLVRALMQNGPHHEHEQEPFLQLYASSCAPTRVVSIGADRSTRPARRRRIARTHARARGHDN